jgi:hypothetical protein
LQREKEHDTMNENDVTGPASSGDATGTMSHGADSIHGDMSTGTIPSPAQNTWDNPTDTVSDGNVDTVGIAGTVGTPGTADMRDDGDPAAPSDDTIGALTTGGTGTMPAADSGEGTFEGAGRSYGDPDTLRTDDS